MINTIKKQYRVLWEHRMRAMDLVWGIIAAGSMVTGVSVWRGV